MNLVTLVHFIAAKVSAKSKIQIPISTDMRVTISHHPAQTHLTISTPQTYVNLWLLRMPVEYQNDELVVYLHECQFESMQSLQCTTKDVEVYNIYVTLQHRVAYEYMRRLNSLWEDRSYKIPLREAIATMINYAGTVGIPDSLKPYSECGQVPEYDLDVSNSELHMRLLDGTILTGTLQPTSILGTDALCSIASEFFTLQFTKS